MARATLTWRSAATDVFRRVLLRIAPLPRAFAMVAGSPAGLDRGYASAKRQRNVSGSWSGARMDCRLLSALWVAGVGADDRIQKNGTAVPGRRRGMANVESNGCLFECSRRRRRIARRHHGGAVPSRDVRGERDARYWRRRVQRQRYAGGQWHRRESRVQRAPVAIGTAWPAVPGSSTAPRAAGTTPVFWLEVVARKRSAGTRAVGARRRCKPATTGPKSVRDRRQPVEHEHGCVMGAM
jgi:hypothetical protein